MHAYMEEETPPLRGKRKKKTGAGPKRTGKGERRQADFSNPIILQVTKGQYPGRKPRGPG